MNLKQTLEYILKEPLPSQPNVYACPPLKEGSMHIYDQWRRNTEAQQRIKRMAQEILTKNDL